MVTLITKKTVYISLPISGLPDAEARSKALLLKEKFTAEGFNVITPFDVVPEKDRSYGHCMGRDIEAIIGHADIVYFASGWWRSRGCRLEFCASVIYRKCRKYGTI